MPPPSGGLGKTGLTRELAEMLLNAQAVTPNAQRGDAGNGEAEVLTYRRTPLCRWLPGSAPPTVACRPVGVVGWGAVRQGEAATSIIPALWDGAPDHHGCRDWPPPAPNLSSSNSSLTSPGFLWTPSYNVFASTVPSPWHALPSSLHTAASFSPYRSQLI